MPASRPTASASSRRRNLVEVHPLPPHLDLDYAVQLTERKVDGDQNTPPNHRADPKQPNLDLHDRIDALRTRVIISRKGLLRTWLHPKSAPGPQKSRCSPSSKPPTESLTTRDRFPVS